MSDLLLESAGIDDFDRVYEIMREAFPPSELRSRDGQIALFQNNNYKLHVCRKDGKIIAFIAGWKVEDIDFIEHFAVDKTYRGGGLGARMMNEYVHQTDSMVLLEVEPPDNDVAQRRIAFYKRLGFHLNDFPYVQPAMQIGQSPIQLKIMTYPGAIDESMFNKSRSVLLKHVYQTRGSGGK